MLFASVATKISLILVVKPGTEKSLSSQLINNLMKGKYTYFQSSESTKPEDNR